MRGNGKMKNERQKKEKVGKRAPADGILAMK